MDINIVKNELKNYSKYKANIVDLNIRLNSLEDELSYIQCKQLNEVNIHTNAFHSNVESYLDKKEIITEDLKRKIRDNETKIERIDNSLSILSEREKEILIDVYIKQLKYSRLEQKYFISYSRIKQIEKESLRKISCFFIPITEVC